MCADTVFDHLQRHPRVCNTCFRLRHDEDPIPEHIERLAMRTEWAASVTEPWTQTAWAESDAPPGETVSEWGETTVCECGCVSAYVCRWREADEPLDFGTLIGYTDNLSKTLDELAVEAFDRGDDRLLDRWTHDRDVLFQCVRHLKSKPENQYKDGIILAASVRVACRRAPENHVERPLRQSL